MKLDKIKIGDLFATHDFTVPVIIKVIYVDEQLFKTQRFDDPENVSVRAITSLYFLKYWRLVGNCPKYLKQS